jgi:hypothetical protein
MDTCISSALVLVLAQVAIAWLSGSSGHISSYWARRKSTSASASAGVGAGDGKGAAGPSSFYQLLCKIATLLCIAALSVVLILVSATSMQGVGTSAMIPQWAFRLSEHLRPFHITSGYGLFRSMTGVHSESLAAPHSTNKSPSSAGKYIPSVVARPEIVIEGLSEAHGWQPVHFAYKPGDVHAMPRIVAPLQPRLDWQMWFAALGSYQHNPWLISLAYKLLTPHNEHIWDILDTRANANVWGNGKEASRLPRSVRMTLWDYSFTFYNTTWARRNTKPERTLILPEGLGSGVARAESSPWWFRSHPKEYLGNLEASNPQLLRFLEAHGLAAKRSQSTEDLYAECLSTKRTYFVDSHHRTSPASHPGEGAGAATLSMFRKLAAYGLDGIQQTICSSINAKFYVSHALSGDWMRSNTTKNAADVKAEL